MRYIIIVILSVFLASCDSSQSPRLIECHQVDMQRLSLSSQKHVMAYCAEEMQRIKDKISLKRDKIKVAAAEAGMEESSFVETQYGRLILAREYTPLIVSIGLIVAVWWLVITFLRTVMWEQDSATRKKWGPFSVWETKYSRRKNLFLETSPAMWVFIVGIFAILVTSIVYSNL